MGTEALPVKEEGPSSIAWAEGEVEEEEEEEEEMYLVVSVV